VKVEGKEGQVTLTEEKDILEEEVGLASIFGQTHRERRVP